MHGHQLWDQWKRVYGGGQRVGCLKDECNKKVKLLRGKRNYNCNAKCKNKMIEQQDSKIRWQFVDIYSLNLFPDTYSDNDDISYFNFILFYFEGWLLPKT